MLTLPEIPAPPERAFPAIDARPSGPPAAFRSTFTAGDMAAHEAAILLRLGALDAVLAGVMGRIALDALPIGPERRDEMEALGFGFGLDRDDVAAPAGSTPAEVAAFDRGWAAGREEWDRRLDVMCGASAYSEAFGGVNDRDLFPGGVA